MLGLVVMGLLKSSDCPEIDTVCERAVPWMANNDAIAKISLFLISSQYMSIGSIDSRATIDIIKISQLRYDYRI